MDGGGGRGSMREGGKGNVEKWRSGRRRDGGEKCGMSGKGRKQGSEWEGQEAGQ